MLLYEPNFISVDAVCYDVLQSVRIQFVLLHLFFP